MGECGGSSIEQKCGNREFPDKGLTWAKADGGDRAWMQEDLKCQGGFKLTGQCVFTASIRRKIIAPYNGRLH